METEVIISTGAAKYFKKLKDKFAEAIKKIKSFTNYLKNLTFFLHYFIVTLNIFLKFYKNFLLFLLIV